MNIKLHGIIGLVSYLEAPGDVSIPFSGVVR